MTRRNRGRSSIVRLEDEFSPGEIEAMARLNEASAKRGGWLFGDSSPQGVAIGAQLLRRRGSYDPHALTTVQFANRHRGDDSNVSGEYASAARADRYRRSIQGAVDLYRKRAGKAPPGTARAYEKTPVPSFTVGGVAYDDPQQAMTRATMIGDAYQRRRDLFAHLKSAGFSASQLKALRSSRDLQKDVSALYGDHQTALEKARTDLVNGFAEFKEGAKGKGLKSRADVIGDALKNRISLNDGRLKLLPEGKGDSRFAYIMKALDQAGIIGQASAMASRGASSGRYSSRSGASGGASEYSSHISRDVSTGSVKGTERGWTRATSSGGWIGGSEGAGGSPAGQAGSAVRRLLSEAFGAYPGGEFRGELANGKLDFTEDTRGQGMGLRAGFHSSRETKVNNALTDFNNWASKQYGDYLVSAQGRADREMQRSIDLVASLRRAEMKNINNQLASMVWLSRNGYGAPAVSEPEALPEVTRGKGDPDTDVLKGTGVENATGLDDIDERPV